VEGRRRREHDRIEARREQLPVVAVARGMPKRAATASARERCAEQTAATAAPGTRPSASISATPIPVPITPTRTVSAHVALRPCRAWVTRTMNVP
jgi:hypothetical protein